MKKVITADCVTEIGETEFSQFFFVTFIDKISIFLLVILELRNCILIMLQKADDKGSPYPTHIRELQLDAHF